MTKISNEDIYDKLIEIEDLLKNTTQANIRFHDINEWRMYIWEGCKYKEEKISEKEIDFYCNVIKGPCEYPNCPRNKTDSGYE